MIDSTFQTEMLEGVEVAPFRSIDEFLTAESK